MSLLEGEHVLKSSDKDLLRLTNYRVTFNAAASGASKHISIPLDAVASCGLVTRSYPWLLLAAGICVIAALFQNQSGAAVGLLVVAAAFVGAYFITRSAVITVSSNGGESIVVPARGMSHEQIAPFLDAVLEAKLRFSNRLRTASSAADQIAAAGQRAAA